MPLIFRFLVIFKNIFKVIIPLAAATIIVCTINRAKSLVMTLDSIAAAIAYAADMATEVVIVDNGSTDDTQQVIKQWAKSVSFPVKSINEPRPGLSCARNAGIRTASREILVFTDDDCCLNSDYIVMLQRHYAKDTEPVMRGGRVELGDPTDMPFTIKLDDQKERMKNSSFPGGFIIGANMAIKREIVDKIGLFDERFGAGASFNAAEETDYIWRVYKAGIPVEYVPDMTVKHFHGRKDKESIIRSFRGYNIGNGALYAKYITDWRLLRHFYWDFRKYIYEIFGGMVFNANIGLSYKDVISGNLQGMKLYFLATLSAYFRRR